MQSGRKTLHITRESESPPDHAQSRDSEKTTEKKSAKRKTFSGHSTRARQPRARYFVEARHSDRVHSYPHRSRSQERRPVDSTTKMTDEANRLCNTCSDLIKKRDYKEAERLIKEFEKQWCDVRSISRRRGMPEAQKKAFVELESLINTLSIISKYHSDEFDKSASDIRPQSSSQGKGCWDSTLPSDYQTLDWEDFQKSANFVDRFLLDDKMHQDCTVEARKDRLRAAHRHLIWIKESRRLKNTFHIRWAVCYIKTCEQLLELDSEFAGSIEGGRARELIQLKKQINTAPDYRSAFALLTDLFRRLANEQFSSDLALLLFCAVRIYSEKWLHTETFTGNKGFWQRQSNTLIYSSGILALGIRGYYHTTVSNKPNEFRQFKQSLRNYGNLGIPIYEKANRNMLRELLNEAKFTNDNSVRNEIALHISSDCGLILSYKWCNAMNAIERNEFDLANQYLRSLKPELYYPPQREAFELISAWCEIKQNKCPEAIKRLNKLRVSKNRLKLEKARLYYAAGEFSKSLKIIEDTITDEEEVSKIPYEQLREQIHASKRREEYAAKEKQKAEKVDTSQLPEITLEAVSSASESDQELSQEQEKTSTSEQQASAETALFKHEFETDIDSLKAKFEQEAVEQKAIIEQLKQLLFKEQSEKQELQRSYNELSESNEGYRSEIVTLKQTYDQYEQEVKSLENNLLENVKALEEENITITEKYNCLKKENDALIVKYRENEELILENKKLTSKLHISETMREIHKKNSKTVITEKMTMLEKHKEIQEKLGKLQNELKQLKQTSNQLENQASKDKNSIESLKEGNNKLSKHITAIEKENEHLRKEISEQKEQVDISNRSAAISEAENLKNFERIESLTKQLSDQEAHALQSEKRIRDDEVKPLNKEIVQLKKQLDERDDSLKALEMQYEKDKKSIESLKEGNNKLSKHITAIEKENEHLRKEISEQKEQIVISNQSAAISEAENLKNIERIESLTKQLSDQEAHALQSEKRIRDDEVEPLNKEIVQLKKQLDERDDSLKASEKQYEKDKKSIESLKEGNNKLSKHITAIEKENEHLRKEISEQKEQIVISNRSAAISEAENLKNIERIESLTKQLSDQEAHTLQSEKRIRDDEVEPLNKEIVQLKKQLDERDGSLKALEKQYEIYKTAKEIADKKHQNQLGQLKYLQQSIDTLEETNIALEKELEKKSDDFAVLSAEASDEYEALEKQHTMEYNKFSETINQLEKKVEALQSINVQKEKHKELTTTSSEMDDELTKAFNELENEVKEYEEKTAKQSKKIQQLENEIKFKRITLDGLQKSLDNKNKAQTKSDATIKTLRMEKEALAQELMILKSRFGI